MIYQLSISEILVLFVTTIASIVFLILWYAYSHKVWPSDRIGITKRIFEILPIASLVIILYTLKFLASFDVINDFLYIIFYVILGYAWIYACILLMSIFFDISWIDDCLNLNNKAAVMAICGGFIGITIIYSGANIGDGPGWMCVVSAGGLGTIAWFALGIIINIFTDTFERITIGRDINCGVRFGFYLLASGFILGRASAGDWTSMSKTIVEFLDGWPVLILAVLVIVIENYYRNKKNADYYNDEPYISESFIIGAIYLAFAFISIALLPPLPENPKYSTLFLNLIYH